MQTSTPNPRCTPLPAKHFPHPQDCRQYTSILSYIKLHPSSGLKFVYNLHSPQSLRRPFPLCIGNATTLAAHCIPLSLRCSCVLPNRFAYRTSLGNAVDVDASKRANASGVEPCLPNILCAGLLKGKGNTQSDLQRFQLLCTVFVLLIRLSIVKGHVG